MSYNHILQLQFVVKPDHLEDVKAGLVPLAKHFGYDLDFVFAKGSFRHDWIYDPETNAITVNTDGKVPDRFEAIVDQCIRGLAGIRAKFAKMILTN